ncbi:MarR family transcriptional regulator [Actinomadura spongiicola]|uniref:MarR family transcriptional regulator n=2 Tax=Actinomadura spongiicola TaxID=2303421 RepID=A0A372GF53_9ACTN|nr:MarR family transcriptional regulator [Actinomadura spongiicola]
MGDMTDTPWLDADEQETWRAFLWTSRLLNEALDRQLQRDSGMPHAYYMILAMLSESPGRARTMSELAELVHSSPSRLSHAVNRLEDAGWVRRSKQGADRRTTIAELTDEGFTALAKAAPGHVTEVRRHLFDPLTREQMLEFRATLHTLLSTLDSCF